MGNQRQVPPFIRGRGSVLALAMISLTFLLGLTSCQPAEEAIDDSITVPYATLPPLPDLDVQCYQDRYAIAEEDITRKVDILIVPDTSGSIKDERAMIADGFDSFLAMMPEIADIRVGVMLGHGSTSSRNGKIYQRGSEPLVLDNQIHSVEEIKTHLRTKMYNPHTDGATDGGEAGLHSLNSSLGEDRYRDIQAEGFYRDDAALVVIFVADEQDICAEFPQGVTPVPDPQGKEASSYIRDCTDGNGNRTLTSQVVLDNLKNKIGDKPLVVGGVLYNNLNTITFKGENELGYGYLEMIEQAGGITVDMATGDYGNGLSKLGLLAMTKIDPVNDFNLKVSNVDKETVRTFVNGVEVDSTYDVELNIVSLNQARDTFDIADVQYCEKPEVSKKVIQVVSGGNHNCALLATGEVKCWGDNTYGQLGLGHNNSIGDDELATSAPTLNFDERVLQLTTGYFHTCAFLESGKVKCWGRNNFGQLGLGHKTDLGGSEDVSEIPYVDIGTNIRKLYSGTYYNCALFKNGQVKCWGQNSNGQLGTQSQEVYGDDELASAAPFVNLGGVAYQMDLSTLSNHACAILDGGNLRCWGDNKFGQLGVGNTESIGDDEAVSTGSFAAVGKPVIMVTTGSRHTCAILSDNSLTCFGGNNLGQLGRGDKVQIGDDELPSTLGALTLGFEAKYVSAANVSTCVVSTNNEVKCWGHNLSGKLGQGHTSNLGDNEEVSTIPFISLGAEIETISSGVNHKCFLASGDGLVKCIGRNDKGQLGNGNTENIGDNELPSTTSFLDFLPI